MIESLIYLFVGVAFLATIALYTRQPLIFVYIVLGVVFGPYALGLVHDADVIKEIGEIGVLFLLFLIGLELPPKKLMAILGEASMTAIGSCLTFLLIGMGLGYLLGFSLVECVIAGIASMFSSTVLGVKLLPTTVLHHRHVGELVIGILLIQDIIAVAALIYIYLFVTTSGETAIPWMYTLLAIVPILALAIYGAKYIVFPLLRRFDVISDYILLLVLGWCLLLSGTTYSLGLGHELGAFLAGVALANSPVTQGIAQSMTLLRDFFLVLFFFSVGASLNYMVALDVWWQILVFGSVFVVVKPAILRAMLGWSGESKETSWEVGSRLGQCSEFSLLILYLVAEQMTPASEHVVLGAVILTFVISSYSVVFRYKSPLAVSDRLRVD